MSESPTPGFRSGFVAVVGRSNVGKSTLVNQLVGTKVAIVTPVPQTTRNTVRGILTRPNGQIIFMDTPGIHKPKYRLNRRMVRAAVRSLASVDAVMLVLDASTGIGKGDAYVARVVADSDKPVIAVLNKVDRVRPKSRLLPMMQQVSEELGCREVFATAAIDGSGCDPLFDTMLSHLPEGPELYPPEQSRDSPDQVLAAELVREQLLLATRQEVPHATAVYVTRFEQERADLLDIEAVIVVEKESQRPIVIGRDGARLKSIGSRARPALEGLFGTQVMLRLWVRVREHWRNDERFLERLGIRPE